MLEISSEYIFDLIKTKVDFQKETDKIYIRRSGVWFSLNYDDCTIWVESMGSGLFKLYRVPVGFDFDFENTWKKCIFPMPLLNIYSDFWVIECPTPFAKVVENLRKR